MPVALVLAVIFVLVVFPPMGALVGILSPFPLAFIFLQRGKQPALVLMALIFGVIWLMIYLISKYSSLASLLGSLSVPLYILVTNQENLIFYFIMFILIFYTHKENIKRLINKEENKTKIY